MRHVFSRRPRTVVLALLTVLWFASSFSLAGPADSFGLDFRMPEDSRTGGIIIFIADGLNARTFQELLEAGELPSIRTYFLNRGLYVPRAAASHPSLTIDNLVSITTGRFPGHHGVVAAKWFDRNRLIFRNYETLTDKNKLDNDYKVESLYDQFSDRLTFSLFLQAHRGSTYFYENWMSAGPAVAFAMHGLVDRLALSRFGQAMAVARQYGQFPAVMTVYQLSVNFTAYDDGATSKQYRQAMRELDRQFGRVLKDLERAGMLDKVDLALVSDHGHCDTPKHGRVQEYVRSLGISLADAVPAGDGTSFEQRLARFGHAVAVPYGAGDRYWVLYLRKPLNTSKEPAFADWLQRPSPAELRRYPARAGQVDLPARLADLPYVDAVAYLAGPGCVRVVRKGGEVEFRRVSLAATQPGDSRFLPISYRLVAGTDPLEWAGKVPPAALAGRPLTGRQWLRATAGTDFPDLPTGLLSYFDGALAADIVAFPAPQWDFDGWRRAGHGGIRDFEVFAPMLLAGPGIPHGRIPVARTVDLMPTLLQAMGKPVPAGLDGESLIGQVQANEPRP